MRSPNVAAGGPRCLPYAGVNSMRITNAEHVVSARGFHMTVWPTVREP